MPVGSRKAFPNPLSPSYSRTGRHRRCLCSRRGRFRFAKVVGDKVRQCVLNLIALEWERGWQGRITQDHGVRSRPYPARRGEVRHPLMAACSAPGEAKRRAVSQRHLQDVYGTDAKLGTQERSQLITVDGPVWRPSSQRVRKACPCSATKAGRNEP